jgi:hypothetical protein
VVKVSSFSPVFPSMLSNMLLPSMSCLEGSKPMWWPVIFLCIHMHRSDLVTILPSLHFQNLKLVLIYYRMSVTETSFTISLD